jgi:ABC-type uncharacterized transport system permease subunit
VSRARLERAWLPAALSFVGIVLILNLISFAFGEAPASTLRLAIAGTWGTPYGIGQVLFKATPLIFTALAFEVALRAGLFNIGAEGQLALASLAGGYLGEKLPPGTPWPIAVSVCALAAALTGALVALAPALMRARLGVHEIISTIMMNRIVEVIVPFVLVAVLGATALRTPDVVAGAALPRLDRLFPSLTGSAAGAAFPLAVLLAFAADAWLRRSRTGREMRWTGQNAETCRAEGIDVRRRLTQAMLLSGAIAGLAMLATVLGYKGYFELGLGAGSGFTGIAVALLGRGHPLGIVLAAVLFGTLQQAGLAINARVPKEAMDRAFGLRDPHRRRRQPKHRSRAQRRGPRARADSRRSRGHMSSILSLTMLAETLRIAVPYACASIGGIWAERAGIIHIGLEGVLLTSAFTSVAVAVATGSAALGLAAGVAAGAAISLVHALLVERARVHAVVSGIALNLLAFAGTRLALRGLYDSASNSPSIPGFRFGPTGASGLALLGRVLLDPVTILAVAAAVATPFVLSRTRFGLRARASGENPVAAASVGIDVPRVRTLALLLSGAICALGGVHLAFDQHRFESGMSNGRGFMALAAVVVSGWRAERAVLACIVFGALEALQIVLQDQATRSAGADLIQLLPYVATLLVLGFAAGRSAAPKGLGKHADD